MNLKMNGKTVEAEENISLYDFLVSKQLEPERLIVELNFEIVPKEQWKDVVLKENDSIEVLRFVGGG
ncbi:MAG TPA: sulfur carrier protein ThiS [Thermoclostridium caenicola]|uniref:Sulfur carrier protein n=1 Tax=Thermoclostridium caenicola TaxID=659425 RepID=A0A1M6IF72_9FIRM|nr:sulfur carrier protein ThiS [Thermoclostridium caenicola]SHJ33100.1 sulfur carrier protein [Thermoclostridium caenicola]HOK42620.1 sulfur carrier protein ThiS [Thermoclostridium caenicola]HOL84400.1 sulfur carrier protein ThiS [Thermoclostridium caenicola]HPO75931.1 sulfur carrier protein ThiS [Thermoclostridium caenicola]